MKRMQLSRRRFTAGAGATLLAAPFAGLLGDRVAAAATTGPRLVIFFTPNGTVHRHWRPTGSGRAFSFAKGSILEPLTPHKADLTVIDGLDFVGASNHAGGMGAMLTGGGKTTDDSGGMSVDQYVAGQIGGASRFRSLELGVQTSAWGGNNQTRMSYGAPGRYVPPNDSPVDVYRRLFPLAGSGASAAAQRLREQRSVLDVVRGDMADLRLRLGVVERRKLDQHLQSLRDMERGLSTGAPGACKKSLAPTGFDAKRNADFPKVGQAQINLLVAALACGMTRVASIQWSHTVGPPVFSWLGLSQGHHALSHMSDSNAAGVADFVKAERWFATQFAALVKALGAATDPITGKRLLDNCVVLWAKELGDGRLHTCKAVPFVVAGRGGGLKPGQFLRAPGVSHQKLLVSLCQAMGLKNATFGDPSRSTGALSGLT